MSKLGALLLVLALLVPTATAATITITPASIDPGDTVTVDVQNLPDGAAFSFGIRGEFDVTPGERFAFTAQNLVLPFSLDPGQVSAYSKGTAWTGLSVQMPGRAISLSNDADANGEFRETQNYNISSGTYDTITLDGRAAPTSGSITAELTMMGTKTGPDNGQITFAIDGITHGTATVTIYVDGRQELSRTIAIGGGISSPTTTTQGSGSGGTGGLFPTEPTTGPATTASTDGKASLTGTDLEGAGLLPITVQGTAPAGWSLSGNAYAVTPADRTFDPAAVLSFRLPSADTTATLARYENGAWTPVPSKIEGNRITTTVTLPGSYALLIAAPAAGSTATATTSIPAGTTTTTTTAPAATTPAAAPIAPLLPVIAFGILMFGWKRRG
ncbi:hypothetical protein [Methanoculleus sp.]|uniref:hypothetical protein n=1 Tax=Methanoculleus sp. TaxID=90427 RepID=UPI0025D0F8FD|nr:hypothetical protein [Methanoculleus sp.]